MTVNTYHSSVSKKMLDVCISVLVLTISFPISLVISGAILVTEGFPVFFVQKRVGKNGRVFKLLKFRTMIPSALRMQNKYLKYNEADGPVFKIYDDPRFTRIGKFLSRTGLDELPQIVNVLRGEMSMVGPRPLPVKEAAKLTKEQKIRELVRPGITSPWVIQGAHKLKFKEWMNLDRQYVGKASVLGDIKIILRTFGVVLRFNEQDFV